MTINQNRTTQADLKMDNFALTQAHVSALHLGIVDASITAPAFPTRISLVCLPSHVNETARY